MTKTLAESMRANINLLDNTLIENTITLYDTLQNVNSTTNNVDWDGIANAFESFVGTAYWQADDNDTSKLNFGNDGKVTLYSFDDDGRYTQAEIEVGDIGYSNGANMYATGIEAAFRELDIDIREGEIFDEYYDHGTSSYTTDNLLTIVINRAKTTISGNELEIFKQMLKNYNM